MQQFQSETKNFVDDLKTGQNAILVAVRVRPLSDKEKTISEFQTIKILDDQLIILMDPEQNSDDVLRKNRAKETQFAFDFVFNPTVIQQTVYDKTTEFLLDGLLEGYNTTVFSYGATGSGKTYTMIGTQSEQGIMPRTMHSLFAKLNNNKFKDVRIQLSYLEIYNETIKDLLSTEDKNLDVREDKQNGVVVAGITEVDVKTVPEVMSLFKVGNKNRSKEATEANLQSSRSHAILQLNIESKEKNQGLEEQFTVSKLSLVDLAGSERAANTNNKGQRMVEGAKINQSLLVLGNCIQALSEANEKNIKQPFVPYRNSKLTRLLKDSLGGNCRTVMISNVSPAASAFDETYNTLVYANRAKNIKTVANRNVLNAANHVSNYAELIQNLRQENEELKQLISQQQHMTPQKSQVQLPPINQNVTQNPPSIKKKDLENGIQNCYNEILDLKRKMYDTDAQLDSYQQNLQFLESQRGNDILDKKRIQDRIDNCKQNIQIIQRGHEDLEKQYDEQLIQKEQIQKSIKTCEDNNYKNYLHGLIKQGDLQIENLDIKEKDKKNKRRAQMQEQQIQLLKNQLRRSKDLPSNSNLKPSLAVPGVNSPYQKNFNYQPYKGYSYQYDYKKKHLKLPPLTDPLRKKTATSNSVIHPPATQDYRMNYQLYRYKNQSQSRQSLQPTSRSKSAANKSLNTSQADLKSGKQIRNIHNQYNQNRFASGKRVVKSNQKSVPIFKNKVLLPGMVHQSPYVLNFQKDLDPEEVKRERLKRLNINLKGDRGQKFQYK